MLAVVAAQLHGLQVNSFSPLFLRIVSCFRRRVLENGHLRPGRAGYDRIARHEQRRRVPVHAEPHLRIHSGKQFSVPVGHLDLSRQRA